MTTNCTKIPYPLRYIRLTELFECFLGLRSLSILKPLECQKNVSYTYIYTPEGIYRYVLTFLSKVLKGGFYL